jgi:hypothetical protein
MDGIRLDRERGQVLILVALMVVVLFGFVALAIDVGNIYGGRRRMQNAADAGALAGARELCFGSGDRATARLVAEDYATNRNGAQGAFVDIPSDGYTVTVVASQTLDTFLAGVIGIPTADVNALAVALCGRAIRGGGLWPLAFRYEVYSDTILCDQEFLVFSRAGTEDQLDCADGCDCVDAGGTVTETTEACEDLCNCDSMGPHLTTANRGWLQFPEPGEEYPDDCVGTGSCGEPELECWIRNNHPGPINVGDCVPGNPGVRNAAENDINSRIGDIVNIVLWERPCCDPDFDAGCTDPPPLSDCPGTPYLIEAFGCVEVMGWEQIDIPKCGDLSRPCQNGRNLQVVRVRKVCDDPLADATSPEPDPYDLYCRTLVGVTDGELPISLELRAVALVR